MLREPGKSAQSKNYIWLYRAGGDSEYPIILYEYSPSRRPKNAGVFLESLQGWLHMDEYPGYHNLPKQVRVIGCRAHARRESDEVVNSLTKQKQTGNTALGEQRCCSTLFALEKEFTCLAAEGRYKQQQKRAKPILGALSAWAGTKEAPPGSISGKVLHYLREQWLWLVRFLYGCGRQGGKEDSLSQRFSGHKEVGRRLPLHFPSTCPHFDTYCSR